ncbi:MAG TPA: hypothetical protein VD997_06605 [Phycisphaerales bacterium]|nr:hypothetical protein [Phycisphaerales bacterium]
MRTLLLALALLLATTAHAQPRARPGSVVHLTITGNLETMQAARELKVALVEAERDRCALVVLHLSGDESRLDVVHAMARALRECPVPTVAYLQDSDQKVGAGALALGLVADDCILAPQLTIHGRTAGISQAALAPDAASNDTVLEELAAWMQPQAKERALPESLDTALLSPSRPVWAVINSNEVKAAWERPADGEVIPVVIEKDGHHLVSLAARDAVRLRYASATLETWPLVLNRRDLKNAPRVERSITAGVAIRSMRAESLLTTIDQQHDAAKAALKLPWPAAKDLSAAEYHKAAATALAALKQATAALTELEKLLETYPEVMRRPAPGQTAVAGKPSTYTTKWRAMVQQRRDRIKKLEDTARKFEQA